MTTSGLLVSYLYAARYVYDGTVVQNDNTVRITPYSDPRQVVLSHTVGVRPSGTQAEYRDQHGNTVHRLRVTEYHRELLLMAVAMVRLHPWESSVPDMPLAELAFNEDLEGYVAPTAIVDPGCGATLAHRIAGSDATLVEAVTRVNEWVHQRIEYRKGVTTVNTTAAEVLAIGKGVCQDKTHLTLALLRALGVPSRYVSGLLTRQPGDTHAWIEFHHPTAGWLPVDPTKGRTVLFGADYLKLAVGRDYSDVSPVTGSFLSAAAGRLDKVFSQVRFGSGQPSMDDAVALLGPTPAGRTPW
jgi:transglutaminase-like putative cysteine protease